VQVLNLAQKMIDLQNPCILYREVHFLLSRRLTSDVFDSMGWKFYVDAGYGFGTATGMY